MENDSAAESKSQGQLLLEDAPANADPDLPQLQPGGPAIKLNDLGPLVVNSDGTLSRIANWDTMTEPEKERIVRVLTARNKIRLANEAEKLNESATTS